MRVNKDTQKNIIIMFSVILRAWVVQCCGFLGLCSLCAKSFIGSPVYIRDVTVNVSKTFDTTVTQNVTVIGCGTINNINVATPDNVFLVDLLSTIDGKYEYKNRGGGSGAGNNLSDTEYWFGADVGNDFNILSDSISSNDNIQVTEGTQS